MSNTKQIVVEDYGVSVGDAIIALSKAIKNTPLKDRAIAVLLHDYDKKIPLSTCERILEILPRLERYYVKD